jgi:hypothetical protein
MIVNINARELKDALSKLMKISSLNLASYTSSLRFITKKDKIYIEAINEQKTQSLIIKIDETKSSVQEDGSFCIPAKPLYDTIDNMNAEYIEMSFDKNLLSLKKLPKESEESIQIIETIDSKEWFGMEKSKSNQIFQLNRSFFIDMANYTASVCSQDKSKAPLTAIHVKIMKNGIIQCTSTDYYKVSLYDCKNGLIDTEILEDVEFMLPVDAAKKIEGLFEKGIDIIEAKIDDKKIVLNAGNIIFSFATEVGVDRYPPLRSYIYDNMDVYTTLNLEDLTKNIKLISAVAPKASCHIQFLKDKIIFEAKEKRNKSKQIIKTEVFDQNQPPQDIYVSVYDLLSSVSIPKTETIDFGLVSITNNAFGYLLELRKEDENFSWRQIIIKSKDEVQNNESL